MRRPKGLPVPHEFGVQDRAPRQEQRKEAEAGIWRKLELRDEVGQELDGLMTIWTPVSRQSKIAGIRALGTE